MTEISDYPLWADQETKDIYLTELARIVNQNATTSVGTGGPSTSTTGLMINSTSGEVLQGDSVYGYSRRYLFIRVTSDSAGNTVITDLNSFSGSNIFVHTYNSNSISTPDASVVFRSTQFDWDSNNGIFYNNIGGGRLEFSSEDETPGPGENWTQITDGTQFRFDLESGVSVGPQGIAGADAFSVRIEARMRPAGVPASSIGADDSINPADWDFAPSGTFFRNNDGAIRTLVAFARSGTDFVSLAAHQGGTYSWTKNGQISSFATAGANRFSRWVPITAADITDGGEDTFVCNVTIPDNLI